MRCGVVFGLLAALSTVAVANPYDGRLLTLAELKAEARGNEALDAYMLRNGLPDVAESRALSDRPPWDSHEVTLYYLGTRKEISFARAIVLGKRDIGIERFERDLSDADVVALMDVLETSAIEPDDGRDGAIEAVAHIEVVDTVEMDPSVDVADDGLVTIQAEQAPELLDIDLGDPAERAEAAALRAELAADRVEAAADVAEGAALRAEKAFDRLAAAVESGRKR